MTRDDVKRSAYALPEGLGAPAVRALSGARITSLKDLKKWREADVADLHGVGPKALKGLSAALKSAGISYKK